MSEDVLDCIEVETSADVSRSIIWLHGLGADGYDFEPIVHELHLPATAGTRFVFPHAPVRPVTVNGGMPMRAWYDLASLDLEASQDETGIMESARHIEKLIERENHRGVPTEHIVLAGFSQGGAVTLHTALRHRSRLLGVLALSTYLPLPDTLEMERDPANSEVPVFMAHGEMDEIINVRFGRSSAHQLAQSTNPTEWHEYPMGHGVCPEEVRDIRRWLLALEIP